MAHPALPIADASVYRPNGRTGLRHLRRGTQVLFLLLWLVLFLLTRAQEVIGPSFRWLSIDIFLASDPLVAALTMGAARIVVPTMAISIGFVVFTLVFGRAFCGWICPLGTLIDGADHLLRPPEDRFSPGTHRSLQRLKYYLLAAMVLAALAGVQWAYLLDPLVLLYRGMAAGVYPAAATVLPTSTTLEAWGLADLAMTYHGLAFAPVALLGIVLALTAITPRFYCRYLCPLGAFYGLLSRVPLVRRRVRGCDACTGIGTDKQCITGCRMGAVPANPHTTQNHECIRCMSGRGFCHTEAINFDWMPPRPPERKDVPLDLDRRAFVLTTASGAALAPLVAFSAYHRSDDNTLVRPPRVLEEGAFVDQCIRCAMCVQACPTQTLQLTHLEAGVAGFWTPAITPEVGGCIADCNACSVACPTDAIPTFSPPEADKWPVKMGTVVLEKGLCICYSEKSKCAECIKICPTKAFVVEPAHDDVPKRPVSVDYFRCVGCGLCETKCREIVFGAPALVTFSHGRGVPTRLREEPTATYDIPVLPI